MTATEEENLIHLVLEQLLAKPGNADYLPNMLVKVGSEQRCASFIITRLVSEGLVTQPNHADRYIILATSQATDIARFAGGYKGYKAAQRDQAARRQQEQVEKDQLDRQVAQATISAGDAAIDSAKTSKSSARAAWVSAIAAVVALGFSLWSLYQASQIDELKAQLQELQQQVKGINKTQL